MIGNVGAQHLANALQYNAVREILYSSSSYASVSFNADTDHAEYLGQRNH
jgi:hypothetical protein